MRTKVGGEQIQRPLKEINLRASNVAIQSQTVQKSLDKFMIKLTIKNLFIFFHFIQKLLVWPNNFILFESGILSEIKILYRIHFVPCFFLIFHFLHLVNYNARETNHHLCITQSITHPTFSSDAHQPIPIAF